METITRLPRGLWYEPARRRFRVRKYHNKIVYGPFYYRTLDAALNRLELLNKELADIPKVRKPPVAKREKE